MLKIDLSGSPYEIGFQHGQSLRPLVDGIVRYLAPFDTEHEEMHDTIARLNELAPELILEMKGIADGAQIPFEEIVNLNLKVLHYCTVIAFEESDVGPILGKNLDFPGYAFQTLFYVVPESEHSFIHLGCAGSVASYGGLNDAGLAMGHAVVFLEKQLDNGGIPIAFVRRLALQHSSTTEEAVGYVASIKTKKVGDNIIFLDKHGVAKTIEKAPTSYQVHNSLKRIAFCTNSFVHQEHSHYMDETSDSYKRHRELGNVLSKQKLSESTLKKVLCNKEGNFPVCRKTTQVSFIAFPEQLLLKVADGRPHVESYENKIFTFNKN